MTTQSVEFDYIEKCLSIVELTGKTTRTFRIPDQLPKRTITSNRFSAEVRFPMVYNDEGLFFENRKGERIAVPEVDGCAD